MKENIIHHYLGMVKFYKKHYLCLMLIAVLMGTFCFTTVSCSKDDNAVETSELKGLADRVWEYSLNNPDGFTIDVRNWTVPTEGICVSYKETQNSHSRESLEKVIAHALQHDGYVGGWLDSSSWLYYFDSSRIFPENQLKEARQFGIENGQLSIYVLSTGEEISLTEPVGDK